MSTVCIHFQQKAQRMSTDYVSYDTDDDVMHFVPLMKSNYGTRPLYSMLIFVKSSEHTMSDSKHGTYALN
jgi:hypothetical protein